MDSFPSIFKTGRKTINTSVNLFDHTKFSLGLFIGNFLVIFLYLLYIATFANCNLVINLSFSHLNKMEYALLSFSHLNKMEYALVFRAKHENNSNQIPFKIL